MRRTSHYLMRERAEVRRLVAQHPWATWVSPTSTGLVASPYPTLLEESADPEELVLVSHFGRPDDRDHELGQHEVMVIVEGPHGYISPSWYPEGELVPTWNHVTAHLYGVPEILSDEENYQVLRRLVTRFEQNVAAGRSLDADAAGSRHIATGTVGVRLRVSRFEARAKLSQNKPESQRERIVAELRGEGPFAQPWLADEMARVRSVVAEPTDGGAS